MFNILTANIVVVLVFTMIYYRLSKINDQHFKGLGKDSSIGDALYFALTIQSTVGFGDIIPATPVARNFVMLQQFLLLAQFVEIIKNIYIK